MGVGEGEEAAAETEEAALKVRLPQVKVNIRVPNTLIFRLVTGLDVGCISSGGSLHFSVQSHPRVHGRMSSLPSLQRTKIIEVLTSSESMNQR